MLFISFILFLSFKEYRKQQQKSELLLVLFRLDIGAKKIFAALLQGTGDEVWIAEMKLMKYRMRVRIADGGLKLFANMRTNLS